MADNLLDKASILLTPTAYNDGSMLSIKPENGDGDFDFQRNSAATRVNAQGLVENVQIISSELVTNGDFSNGSTDWTLGTGWSIGENKAISDATQGFITQTNVGGAGVTSIYKVQWTQNITAGTRLRFFARNYNDGGSITILSITRDDGLNIGGGNCVGSGTFTAYVSSTNGYSFKMLAENGVEADITNVSAIEFDEDTNLPRIDYTDGCGSWLLEPQSTNLIPYSEDLSKGSTNRLLLTSSASVSPDGTNTASKLIPNNTNSGYHYFAFSSLTISTNNVYSVFLKKAEYEYALISFETNGLGGSADKALINLNNGNVEQSDTETKVTDYGNGWYRCSIKATSSRTSAVIYPLPSASLSSFTGDNTSGIIAWGLQAEAQSHPTSYIPTNGATNTRLQDIATNSGNSSLINSEEGVLYAEISALSNDATNRAIGILGDANNYVELAYRDSANVIRCLVKSNGVVEFNPTYTLSDATSYSKIAIKYKNNDCSLWVDGVEVATSTSASMPSGLSELNFYRFDGAEDFYGKLKALAVYKEVLTDAELQALTTI